MSDKTRQIEISYEHFFQTKGSVAVLPRKTVSKIKNPATLDTTRIIYGTFNKYSRPLHKLGRLKAIYRRQTEF